MQELLTIVVEVRHSGVSIVSRDVRVGEQSGQDEAGHSDHVAVGLDGQHFSVHRLCQETATWRNQF